MKIAFIHNQKKLGTGAHYINDLMAVKLRAQGVRVKNFYPRTALIEHPSHMRGLANILFFYSLLEQREKMQSFDLIQGTTYTPLPFLAFKIPVVSHFGSTTQGFISATPSAHDLPRETHAIWYALHRQGIINELNIKTRRPLRDIAEIEQYVATRANGVIATSQQVHHELLAMGVTSERIHVIHNMIEDYWFEPAPAAPIPPVAPQKPHIVFLGRLGGDAFTLKLKGLDRLIHLYRKFPSTPKTTVCMTNNKLLKEWLKIQCGDNHYLFANFKKDLIPGILRPLSGSILFIPSRYEGFSLSLVEGMSQGLIPVAYPVGVAPEIIRHGKNGFLVNSQEEAIACMERVLTDTDFRTALSQAARTTAQQFSSTHTIPRLITLYRSLH